MAPKLNGSAQENLDEETFQPQYHRNCDEQFPYLDTKNLIPAELKMLSDKLFKETEEIHSAFGKLVSFTFASLEQKKVSAEALGADIIAFCCWCKPKAIKQDHIDELSSAKSVRKIQVFLIRHKYISFMNFKLMEDITDSYEIDKKKMNEYLSKFSEFCKRSVFEVPSNVIKEHSPDGGERVVVKVSDQWFEQAGKESLPNSFTMQDLLDVQQKIKEVIGCAFVYIHGIEPGCVKITFVIPSPVTFSKHQLDKLKESCICVINPSYSQSPVEQNTTKLNQELQGDDSTLQGLEKYEETMIAYSESLMADPKQVSILHRLTEAMLKSPLGGKLL